MKKPPTDLDRLTRRAIEARLQQQPSERERQWVDDVCATYAEHFGCVPDRDEARRLFWEVELGLDRNWPAPCVEDDPDHPGWVACCAALEKAAG